MEGKTVAESACEMPHMPFPEETNQLGTMHGGCLMKHIDTIGGIVAMRHARSNVVTAAIERMEFHTPVHIGDLLIFKASLNLVGRTSMDVGVRVDIENLTTGKIQHAASCYMTLVALDDNGHPREVPPLILISEEDLRRHAKAVQRRKLRVSMAPR